MMCGLQMLIFGWFMVAILGFGFMTTLWCLIVKYFHLLSCFSHITHPCSVKHSSPPHNDTSFLTDKGGYATKAVIDTPLLKPHSSTTFILLLQLYHRDHEARDRWRCPGQVGLLRLPLCRTQRLRRRGIKFHNQRVFGVLSPSPCV